VAYAVRGQQRTTGIERRAAIGVFDRRHAFNGAEIGRLHVRIGENAEHPWRALRRRDIDLADACMGIGRAQKMGIGLALQPVVIGILAFAFQQTKIFLAADRLSDAELTHGYL
jgi:hypothetical protein